MNAVTADDRLERARAAQRDWAMLTPAARSRVLSRLRCALAERSETIAETIAAECRKPVLDALAGDVLVTLEQLRYYERQAAYILKPRRTGKPSFFWSGTRFEESYEPHGVALVYAPSNYPLQLAVIPMITALAAGNAVVLKCSEKTPRTAELIGNLCAQADLPADLVQVVHEDPERAAALIDAGPDFVFFTGSCAHGRAVAVRCAERLIPTMLELGGKDASLVFADCHMERAVEGVTYGAFSNAGRVCVGIKRLYIEEGIFGKFLVRLVERVTQLRVGDGKEADVDSVGQDSGWALLKAQVEDALSRGAHLHWPQSPTLTDNDLIVLSHVPPDARLLVEETFGPVLCVAPFSNEAEAVALANGSSFALSSSVWTRDRARGQRIAAKMSAGTCAVNDVLRNIGNPYAAFGGNRDSGYGRYHGSHGLLAFSRVKTVMTARGRRKREINWFPFSERTTRLLMKVIALRHRSAGLAGRLSRVLFPVLLCLMFPLFGLSQPSPPAHLAIEVTVSARSHGAVAYLVFASKEGFPADKSRAVRHGFVPVPAGSSKVRIDAGDLPPGRYAVSVYQDVNGNRKLDRNAFGIPKEPVGASNNPAPHWGPPAFNECAFQLGESDKTITVQLVH